MNYNKKSLELHTKKRGKIEITSKVLLKTKNDLSLVYTPGVGAVSKAIGENKNRSWDMTNRANQVAIVSDGTAILGLGDLGPEAAMPVMEGKAVIFKELAGIDAIPLCINTTNIDEIVNFCKIIAPSFGGINLEDIAAPRCFSILKQLEKESVIPVFHDDQDGTAIVVLAALLNACKVSGKNIRKIRIVLNGSGAAGIAVARLLLSQGVGELVMVDSKGIIYKGRKGLNYFKKEIAEKSNKLKIRGNLSQAMYKADVFIGVSKGGLVNSKMVRSMNNNPIIFAMANPIPEIMPEDAYSGGALIVGTGRSDFPNQINNALVFPGLFRGLFDGRLKKITTKMKITAANAIAESVKPTKNKILPSIINKKVAKAVAKAIQ